MNKLSYLARFVFILSALTLTAACAPAPTENTDPVNGGGGGSGGDTSGGGSTNVYGTAILSWLPPTENTDGTSLTNLAGYNIYYGTESGNYTVTITIDNPGVADYIVDNLPPGNTYYFVITAFDADGNESEYSTMGSKTIPA